MKKLDDFRYLKSPAKIQGVEKSKSRVPVMVQMILVLCTGAYLLFSIYSRRNQRVDAERELARAVKAAYTEFAPTPTMVPSPTSVVIALDGLQGHPGVTPTLISIPDTIAINVLGATPDYLLSEFLTPAPRPSSFDFAPWPYPSAIVKLDFDYPTIGTARYSYYWPPLGGDNTAGDYDTMASGHRWLDYVGVAVACPLEFPLGTRFITEFGDYQCLDRGSAITWLSDGSFWLDFLEPEQRFGFWQEFTVRMIYP